MNEKDMMHGRDWTGENLAGWLAFEKYDGTRAYWDGAAMWTRGGTRLDLPLAVRQSLPTVALDGELWAGYQRAHQAPRWPEDGVFMVFDAPQAAGGLAARLDTLAGYSGRGCWEVAPFSVLRDNAAALRAVAVVHARGGEGLVVRDPAAPYLPGRTRAVLKIKTVPGLYADQYADYACTL